MVKENRAWRVEKVNDEATDDDPAGECGCAHRRGVRTGNPDCGADRYRNGNPDCGADRYRNGNPDRGADCYRNGTPTATPAPQFRPIVTLDLRGGFLEIGEATWDNPFIVLEVMLPEIKRLAAELGELTDTDREVGCAILAGAENEAFYTQMADGLQEIGVPELTIGVVVTSTQNAYADVYSKRCAMP